MRAERLFDARLVMRAPLYSAKESSVREKMAETTIKADLNYSTIRATDIRNGLQLRGAINPGVTQIAAQRVRVAFLIRK
jgi:hypothetical protein